MKLLIVAISLLFTIQITGQISKDHLEVGDSAPQILGIDQNGQKINSSIILKGNKILLVFYRGNWCPHCRKHLTSLQDHLNEFIKKGVYVLVVTPETVEKSQETQKKLKTSFSILHDKDNKIMSDYKVAFEANETNVLSHFDIVSKRIAEYNEKDNNVLPVPATYIIDQEGKISYVQYDPDYKNRSDFDEILKSL